MNPSTNELLEQTQTIAVIGCSQKQFRASHQISDYLQKAGYSVIPVHPKYDEILGQTVYPALTDIPEQITVDIVDIFRNKQFTAEMVDQVIERKEQTGQQPVVWTQMEVSSPEAQQKATDAGLTYIKNTCIMVADKRRQNE